MKGRTVSTCRFLDDHIDPRHLIVEGDRVVACWAARSAVAASNFSCAIVLCSARPLVKENDQIDIARRVAKICQDRRCFRAVLRAVIDEMRHCLP